MKILTWNIQRFPKRKQEPIRDITLAQNADILILTETLLSFSFEGMTAVYSDKLLPGYDGIQYTEGENRTSIFTKFPVLNIYPNADSFTFAALLIHHLAF